MAGNKNFTIHIYRNSQELNNIPNVVMYSTLEQSFKWLQLLNSKQRKYDCTTKRRKLTLKLTGNKGAH